MEPAIPVVLGRVDAVTLALRREIDALDDDAAVELFHACEVWGRTVTDGRRPLSLLNGRHEVFVLEAAPPAPWILASFDTTERELVIAALLTDRKTPGRDACGAACAAALGIAVESLV